MVRKERNSCFSHGVNWKQQMCYQSLCKTKERLRNHVITFPFFPFFFYKTKNNTPSHLFHFLLCVVLDNDVVVVVVVCGSFRLLDCCECSTQLGQSVRQSVRNASPSLRWWIFSHQPWVLRRWQRTDWGRRVSLSFSGPCWVSSASSFSAERINRGNRAYELLLPPQCYFYQQHYTNTV